MNSLYFQLTCAWCFLTLLNYLYLQVIIDDSTMCSELESFVPMVTTKAKQYVLLGDPSQHSVPVESDVARRLGLGATLFERYQHKALPITVQYRMVSDTYSTV